MDIERILCNIERSNRGWLKADNTPRMNVYLNGKPINHVQAIHRRKGVAVIFDYPFKLDKWRKRAITRRAYGKITVEPL